MGKSTGKPGRAVRTTESTRPGTPEAVLEAASDQNVSFVRLWFTDVLGMLKSVEITTGQLKPIIHVRAAAR